MNVIRTRASVYTEHDIDYSNSTNREYSVFDKLVNNIEEANGRIVKHKEYRTYDGVEHIYRVYLGLPDLPIYSLCLEWGGSVYARPISEAYSGIHYVSLLGTGIPTWNDGDTITLDFYEIDESCLIMTLGTALTSYSGYMPIGYRFAMVSKFLTFSGEECAFALSFDSKGLMGGMTNKINSYSGWYNQGSLGSIDSTNKACFIPYNAGAYSRFSLSDQYVANPVFFSASTSYSNSSPFGPPQNHTGGLSYGVYSGYVYKPNFLYQLVHSSGSIMGLNPGVIVKIDGTTYCTLGPCGGYNLAYRCD